MKTILGRFVQNRFSPFLLLRPLSLKIKPTSSAYQRPNLNKLLFSEADFQNNIVTRKQPLPIKDGNFHLNDLTKMTDGFDPDDPTNDFFEEVHLGRRCLLCCANVMLTYDSSTGDFTAQTGRIIQKRPPRTQKNTPTTLTVKSKGGCVFHITRYPQGEYQVDNCCTWINVEKMYKILK